MMHMHIKPSCCALYKIMLYNQNMQFFVSHTSINLGEKTLLVDSTFPGQIYVTSHPQLTHTHTQAG